MATQQAPDGTVYEYDPSDAADVGRVAALCEPSYEVKRARAQKAFDAVPAAQRQSASLVANPNQTAGFSADDVRKMIADALKDALVSGALHSTGGQIPTASDEATTPIAEAVTPVEGSGGNA